MDTKDNWVLAKAIALYYYNVSHRQWLRDFEVALDALNLNRVSWVPDYAAEQMGYFKRGFQSHFGELDFERQQIQLQIVLDRYGDEAERAWATCSSFAR